MEALRLRQRLLVEDITEYSISRLYSIPELRKLLAFCGVRTAATRKPDLVSMPATHHTTEVSLKRAVRLPQVSLVYSLHTQGRLMQDARPVGNKARLPNRTPQFDLLHLSQAGFLTAPSASSAGNASRVVTGALQDFASEGSVVSALSGVEVSAPGTPCGADQAVAGAAAQASGHSSASSLALSPWSSPEDVNPAVTVQSAVAHPQSAGPPHVFHLAARPAPV